MKFQNKILALLALVILFAMVGCATVQKGEGVSEQEAKALLDQYMQIVSGGDLAQIDKICTPDFNLNFVGNSIFPPIVGLEALKRWRVGVRTAFPDMNVKTDETIIKGDRITALFTLTGTNTGPGQWAPTGKKIFIEGISIGRIVDGKLDEQLIYYNYAALLRQVGFTFTPP